MYMRVMKKIFNVILIFAVIQIFVISFANNEVYATENKGFFETTFERGQQWKEMGERNSSAIIENANGVFQATEEIYDTVRGIGVALFLVNIGLTAISLSIHNNGRDIAGMKLTIGFTFVLAILFIFAQQIMGFLQGLFEQLEGLM